MRGTIRQRLTVSVVLVTAVMLALLVIGFNLALRSSLDGDANRLLEARAQAALESVSTENGQVKISEGSDEGTPDALVWVYEGDRAVESPQTSSSLDDEAASLAKRGSGRFDDDSSDTRLYATPVLSNGKVIGTVVSGVSLEPYETTAYRSLVASIILGLVMLVLVAVTTSLVVGRALKPVAKMTEEAADWSEHDLDRRFNEGGPDDELSRLASTFDSMLDRMAFMLRHERNFSAELSHELRTPLASISAEAELALNRERSSDEYRQSLQQISARATDLTRILETMLDVARSEGASSVIERSEAEGVVYAAISASLVLAESYGVRLESEVGEGETWVQVGGETLGRVLAPVLENALIYARSSVSVSIQVTDRRVEITVADDGPGFDDHDPEAPFGPGHRGDTKRNPDAPQGTGLGLSLSRRLARVNGGDVLISAGTPDGGGRVLISLPQAMDRDL